MQQAAVKVEVAASQDSGDSIDSVDEPAPNVVALRPRTGPTLLPPTLGDLLRSRREGAKKTLTDVAAITRISERTLRKLEDDENEGLPADVFIRGYLRTLAKVYAFDANDALRLYERDRKESRERAEQAAVLADQSERAARSAPVKIRAPLDRRQLLRFALAGLAVVALVAVGVVLHHIRG
jgi:cytoskeletal protein RodZ